LKKIANLDVVDDYRNEKREIQGRQDEKKVMTNDYGRTTANADHDRKKSRCIIL
ncbi:unnamed protein product, partial [Rotaria sordida]